MSKTDKTRPWRVRAMDRADYLVEHHDHVGRDCDLPAERQLTDGCIYGPRTGCGWKVGDVFWARPENWCGCPHCNGQRDRKAKARRRRLEGRQLARRWRQEL